MLSHAKDPSRRARQETSQRETFLPHSQQGLAAEMECKSFENNPETFEKIILATGLVRLPAANDLFLTAAAQGNCNDHQF